MLIGNTNRHLSQDALGHDKCKDTGLLWVMRISDSWGVSLSKKYRPLHPRLGQYQGRGREQIQELKIWKWAMTWKAIFQAWHSYYYFELTTIGVTCTWLTQNGPCHQLVMNERGTYVDLSLPVEILLLKHSVWVGGSHLWCCAYWLDYQAPMIITNT